MKEVNPIVNCFVEDRFEDALMEAREADKLILSGKMTEDELIKEKPFLGVPFSTKDCIAVKGITALKYVLDYSKIISFFS